MVVDARHNESKSETLLNVKDLVIGYNNLPILVLESLTLSSSEIVSIVGASGVGKSSLLNCLSGKLNPISGNYKLKTAGRHGRHVDISQTLQAFPLLHWLTVRENLRLSAKIKKVKVENFDEVLSNFSALDFADRYPDTLSGGERCRASISQALIGDPSLLLLDEPFSGLDIIVKEAIAKKVRMWANNSKASVLFVTHDIHDAIEFSDKIIVIGRANPAEIIRSIDTSDDNVFEKVKNALVHGSAL